METDKVKIKSILNLVKYLINDLSNIIILYYLDENHQIFPFDLMKGRVMYQDRSYYSIGKIAFDIKILYYTDVVRNNDKHTTIIIGKLRNNLYFYLKYTSHIYHHDANYEFSHWELLK